MLLNNIKNKTIFKALSCNLFLQSLDSRPQRTSIPPNAVIYGAIFTKLGVYSPAKNVQVIIILFSIVKLYIKIHL